MNIIKNIKMALLGAALLIFCLPQFAIANASLVSSDWLAKNLHKKDIVILDVSAFTSYEKRHIPGAVKAFGPWQTMNDNFVGFMMPDISTLEKMIRSYGVNKNSYIIIYDEGVTAMDTAKSARALWTLHALGDSNVAILDGGFAGWELAGNATTEKAATPSRGNFSVLYKSDKIADLAETKSKLNTVVLVDCRVPDEHFGHEKKSHIKRAGHLPNSRLWPASYMTSAGIDLSPSYFMNSTVLETMAKGVGIPLDKNSEIIVYSNHGLSAALDYFVLHDILSYKNVKIFDGSILEAAAVKDFPMVKNEWGYKTL